jgi:hypothetical protein
MTEIRLTIPLALTVSQIARANPTIDDDEARELAQEVHSIIATVQKLYALRPPNPAELALRLPTTARCLPYEAAIAYELGDVIDVVRDTIFGHWPPHDSSEAGDLSCWIMERLTDLDDSDILYVRYWRVHDRIQGTNFAADLTVEEDGAPAN